MKLRNSFVIFFIWSVIYAEEFPLCPISISLPDEVWIDPKPTTNVLRYGFWKSHEGATFATYVQDLWSFQYESLHLEVDGKQMATIGPEHMLSIAKDDLAATFKKRQEETFSETARIMMVTDCNHNPAYYLAEEEGGNENAMKYSIYDLNDVLVATMKTASGRPDQFVFSDINDVDFAQAQSPQISTSFVPVSSAAQQDVQTWEVRFLNEEHSTGPLINGDKRWVVVAVVTERALRLAAAGGPDGKVEIPAAYRWFMVLFLIGIGIILILFVTILYAIYIWVYPERIRQRSMKNFFLRTASYVDPNIKLFPGGAAQQNMRSSQQHHYGAVVP